MPNRYIQKLKDLVLSKGEVCKDETLGEMTLYALPQEIVAPFGLQTYLTLIINDRDDLCSGLDRNGCLFIEKLDEYEAEFIWNVLCQIDDDIKDDTIKDIK
jgi:hypothetical protein